VHGTYTNPLFFDEFSDPDMIRVGSDFYLTGTTMHSMPGLPVLRSRDLVNWTFVSYALDRLDLGPSFRLEDGKNEYGRGIWAPRRRRRSASIRPTGRAPAGVPCTRAASSTHPTASGGASR
jgi:xylan 1,4-beta-xylosidase